MAVRIMISVAFSVAFPLFRINGLVHNLLLARRLGSTAALGELFLIRFFNMLVEEVNVRLFHVLEHDRLLARSLFPVRNKVNLL